MTEEIPLSNVIGYIALVLWLFLVIAPFFIYHGAKKIINDKDIKKIDGYSLALFSGMFPYRKRLRWIGRNYLSFPPQLKKYARRIVIVDKATIAAIIVLLVVYVLTLSLQK